MPQDEQLDDYSPDLITLTDEDGKEFSFEVIDAADYNERALPGGGALCRGFHGAAGGGRKPHHHARGRRGRRRNIWTLWMTMRSFTR